MPAEGESLSKKVQSSYQELARVSAELNAVSDEMGKYVADLDAALKKLNLGVGAWVKIRTREDSQTGEYEVDHLGYSKINGKWGITLGTTYGNYNTGPEDTGEDWLFNDAPRELRLAAIKEIPELFKKLREGATKMAADVRNRLSEVRELTESVKAVANAELKSPVSPKQTGGQK